MNKWNGKRFSIYDKEEKQVLGLLNNLGEQTNYNTEKLAEKTNLYGDHKGTWQGLNKPTLSDEGMKAVVEKLDKDVTILNTININVLEYGVKGDGITNDTKALTELFNRLNDDIYQTVVFPQGYKFLIDNLYINGKKKILLTGGGQIIDGTIHIQGKEEKENLEITVKDLIFEVKHAYEYQPKIISAITLRNCSNVNIYDNRFRYYGRVISFEQPITPIHQYISKIDIQRNVFENVAYCLYNDQLTEKYYLTGDVSFQNNVIYLAWEGVVKLYGIDGLMLNNNTIFTPRHALTKEMIYIDFFNYTRIANNQMFESGYETIKALNGENLNVINNSIPYSGQNKLSSAIYVLDCVMVNIMGNMIERSSDYGINIEQKDNYCSFVNVANNIVRDCGVNPFYRGDDITSSTKIPINVSEGVTRCLVDGNVTDLRIQGAKNNGNNLYDNVFQKNLDLQTKTDVKRNTCVVQPNEIGLSGINTLLKMMVNKRVDTNFLTYEDGTNMIVDDTGTPRKLSCVQVDTYREDFNIIHYVTDGDVRSNFTQHKLYQIF